MICPFNFFILVVPIILPATKPVNQCKPCCTKSEKTENRLYRKSLQGYDIPQAPVIKLQFFNAVIGMT